MSRLPGKPPDPPRQLALLLSMALASRGEPISHQRSFLEGAMRHSGVVVVGESVSCIVYACVVLVSFGRDACAHLESVLCLTLSLNVTSSEVFHLTHQSKPGSPMTPPTASCFFPSQMLSPLITNYTLRSDQCPSCWLRALGEQGPGLSCKSLFPSF